MWSCCLARLSKLLFQVLSLIRGNRSEKLCNQRGRSPPPLDIGLPRASISVTPGIEVYHTQNITEIQQQEMCGTGSFIKGKAVTFWAEMPVTSCLKQLCLSSGTVLCVQRGIWLCCLKDKLLEHLGCLAQNIAGEEHTFFRSKDDSLVNWKP